MENPVQEAPGLIHTLTQSTPSKQKAAINHYFIPIASFTHPFCATGSWSLDLPFTLPFIGFLTLNSRWATLKIYQWYKIMSPNIDLEVRSVTFNEENLKLYVDIHQHFRAWIIPFYDAGVYLTTVLQLAEGDESGPDSAITTTINSQRQRQLNTKLPSEKPYSYAAVADPDSDTSTTTSNGIPKKLYYITSQDDLYQTSEWIKFLLPWGVGYTLVVAWMFFATVQSIVGSFVLFPLTWGRERSLGGRGRI
ncbi:hypothetical protein OHC33_002270 [Knufia fluminis]|uniref:SigF-like NTF2-like domain-containing protein n=1 Tax=Knufia fluminis TaxID=191047 RepID=A0AAN8IR60_9EURO|nr:hypothetical protein OHC33_002270 [Knufia fluminis]